MKVPYYYRSLDWKALVRAYPPSRDFAETVFRYDRTKIARLQNRRFLEIVDYAWRNPFYRRRWEAHGVRRGDIKSARDIVKLPMVAVEDFKEGIKAKPPFGEHQGLGVRDAVRTPIKIQSSGGTTGMPSRASRARARCGCRAPGPAMSCRFPRRSPRRILGGSTISRACIGRGSCP